MKREPTQKHTRLCQPSPGGRVGDRAIVMHDHASLALQPGVSALDDPALGQDDEAARFGEQRHLRVIPFAKGAGPAHDLDGDVVVVLKTLRALAGIGGVRVEHFDGVVLCAGLCDDVGRAVTVLHAGCGHGDGQQQPKRVDDQMTLASLDFLAGVVARRAALRRDARGLRVDDGGSGLGVALDALPPLLAQALLQDLELALSGPSAEALVNRQPGREGLGQHRPRAARSQHIAAGVDHRSGVVLRGPAAAAFGQLEQVSPASVHSASVSELAWRSASDAGARCAAV